MDEREGRGAESLTVKVVPEQPDEFTCRRCFLVKHRTQLKDRRKHALRRLRLAPRRLQQARTSRPEHAASAARL